MAASRTAELEREVARLQRELRTLRARYAAERERLTDEPLRKQLAELQAEVLVHGGITPDLWASVQASKVRLMRELHDTRLALQEALGKGERQGLVAGDEGECGKAPRASAPTREAS